MKELWTLLKPDVEALGCELWGVVYLPQGQHALLRVYIDRKEGVTVDDCERVSRQVGAVLDVENRISGAYTLEVSSPGLDRPLFFPHQYERFKNHLIALRVSPPINGRRKYQGTLLAVNESDIQLDAEGTPVNIPFAQIERANLVEL